jgi:SAM-dependent methyltransferase
MKTRRIIYGLRLFIPGLQERHKLESLVGPLGYLDKLQNYQINLLKTFGLQPEHSLLDVGCGPLQGGIAFISYLNRNNYTGIEIDYHSLSVAYSQVIKHNLCHKNPTLLQSSNFGRDELNNKFFDYIWVSQLMYHLDEYRMIEIFKLMNDILKPGGVLLFDILSTDHYEFKYHEHKHHLHTPELIKKIAALYGLSSEVKGKILEYGYPKQLSLHTNYLVCVRKSVQTISRY